MRVQVPDAVWNCSSLIVGRAEISAETEDLCVDLKGDL